jgi:hypothetical protein
VTNGRLISTTGPAAAAPVFDLRTLTDEAKQGIKDRAYRVCWLHDGWVKRVSAGRLLQTLELLESFQWLQSRRPAVTIPPEVGILTWDQASPTSRTAEDVSHWPTLHQTPPTPPSEPRTHG